jgi:hypothetical protein
MNPASGTGAVKAKQHTHQVKGGVAFAVQQNVKQLVTVRP